MTAFNVVRIRVKPGREKELIEMHRKVDMNYSGFRSLNLIKTGSDTFCLVGEWSNFSKIVAARPKMIGVLDNFRDLLVDLGGGLGVTDPVSGEAVSEYTDRHPSICFWAMTIRSPLICSANGTALASST